MGWDGFLTAFLGKSCKNQTSSKTLFFFCIILQTQKDRGHYITCFLGGSGNWFYNWTYLSQSDFFLWSLLLLLFLLLLFYDYCSWWSSSSWLLSFSSWIWNSNCCCSADVDWRHSFFLNLIAHSSYTCSSRV